MRLSRLEELCFLFLSAVGKVDSIKLALMDSKLKKTNSAQISNNQTTYLSRGCSFEDQRLFFVVVLLFVVLV